MRSCTGEGLPAEPVTRFRRALLPHDFALTSVGISTNRGGMFLLHSSPREAWSLSLKDADSIPIPRPLLSVAVSDSP